MRFEVDSIHTVGEMYEQVPKEGTGWVIFRVDGRQITAQMVNKIVWDRGYFWGEFDYDRHMPSLKPTELVFVMV